MKILNNGWIAVIALTITGTLLMQGCKKSANHPPFPHQMTFNNPFDFVDKSGVTYFERVRTTYVCQTLVQNNSNYLVEYDKQTGCENP